MAYSVLMNFFKADRFYFFNPIHLNYSLLSNLKFTSIIMENNKILVKINLTSSLHGEQDKGH